MKHAPQPDSTSETARLLSELDQALDRSGILRDILRRHERIRQIESITGPSQITRVMRKELEILERRLRGPGPDGAFYTAA